MFDLSKPPLNPGRVWLIKMLQISGGPSLYLVNCMVDLARLVAEIVANANKPDDGSGTVERSSKAIELERYLVDWKSRIPPELNFDAASLEDSELITKQKIVLKLRKSAHLTSSALVLKQSNIPRKGS